MESTSQTTQQTQTGQTWNASQYAANGRFVADLAKDVVALLAPQSGEHILDLGCGDGALTEQIAEYGAVVTGCDASASMLESAKQRGLNVVAADMRSLPFQGEFDAVFSNAALHWVTDLSAVAQSVHRALKPGGRFVAEMGGLGNIAAIRVALQSVMANFGIDAEKDAASRYPSRDEMRGILEEAGFRVTSIELIPRPTLLKSGMDEWLNTFRNGILSKLSEADRQSAIDQAVTLLRPALCDADGVWWGDYVRLRFHAVRG
ncbi:trans-aconitate 2-methyltransferase [Terriglobus sp. TAA 43]|uniref:class I SAM-dependent methyltransferase n=1 Tax=Terriglobus sp. TAA 43 TaxID=278961 RepID=UPI000645BB84|nr:methyltransferase domain-containing protein [Terriglobus sp. TAA 43]